MFAPIPTPSTVQTRRAGMRNANASLALEGLFVNPAGLAIQESYVMGEPTYEQAVAASRAPFDRR